MVHNTALISALQTASFAEVRADGSRWGRLVEASVGAHLKAITAHDPGTALYYWRDRKRGVDYEVDYVLKTPAGLSAIEVKSGASKGDLSGLAAFASAHPGAQTLVVGTGGMALEEFFSNEWVPT